MGLLGHTSATMHSSRWFPGHKGEANRQAGPWQEASLQDGPALPAWSRPSSRLTWIQTTQASPRSPCLLASLSSYSQRGLSKRQMGDHTTIGQDPFMAPCGPKDKALLMRFFTVLVLACRSSQARASVHAQSHIILPTTRYITPFYRRLN